MVTIIAGHHWEDPVDITELFSTKIKVLDPAVPICVTTGTPLRAVVTTLQEKRIGCALVTENDELVGIITERDLTFRVLGFDVDLDNITVDDHMTRDPESLNPETPIAWALNRMKLGGYRHVPLVDENNHPVGIISVKDIVHWLVDEFPDAILNLPPEPQVYGTSREGA